MKKLISVLIIFLSPISVINAQNDNSQLNFNEVSEIVKILIDFDEQFDNGAPESLKKAKFDEFVDKLYPEMNRDNRIKAYEVVNWYIKASKGQKTNIPLSDEQIQEVEQMLHDTENKKQLGMETMLGKLQEVQNMSYGEYKKYVTNNGDIYLPEAEIQKAYNQMHKNDGKQVKVTEKKESDQIDNPIIAISIIDNPGKHTYAEFRAAILYLDPNMPEEKIKKAWKDGKNKNK